MKPSTTPPPDGPYISGSGFLCYRDGNTMFVCECIKGPYAERVVALFEKAKGIASESEAQIVQVLPLQPQPETITTSTGGEPKVVRSAERALNPERYLRALLESFGPYEGVEFSQDSWAHIRANIEAALSGMRSSARVTTDAAGFPKAPPTILERLAVEALNEVKAWRDSDGNEGFPPTTREKIEAILMTYEQRRDPLALDLRDLSTLRLRCGYIINGYGDAKLEAQEMLRLIETAMKAPRSATAFGPAVAQQMQERGDIMPPGILKRLHEEYSSDQGGIHQRDAEYLFKLVCFLWPATSGAAGANGSDR